MSILNGERVNALVSNNAWISKNSYASDSDYQTAQATYSVPFPDSSKAHIYYNSVFKEFRFHDGLAWQSLSTGSTTNKAYFHARISIAGQSLPPPNAVKVNWDTIVLDTESGWQPLSNSYLVPRDGKYLITSALFTMSTTSAVGNHSFTNSLYINGVVFFAISTYVYYSSGAGLVVGLRHHGSHVVDLLQGDTVDIRMTSSANWTSPSIASSSISNDFKIIEL